MKQLPNSIRAIILVIIMGATIVLGFYIKSQVDKAYDNGRAAYQKEINDFIVNSLVNDGELKIRYQGKDGAVDLILVPK